MERDKEKLTCFVAMPISQQPGYEPEHFKFVYEDIIKPAIENAGMLPLRADETQNTNLIQLDILRKVIESDVVICDMSSRNPNVFYELGIRQAFDKPTVLLIDDVTVAPFDVSSLRYVEYKKSMGFRTVKDAVDRLSNTLLDTYNKRNERDEINSLIRLLGLTMPAKIGEMDLSSEDRTSLQIAELTSAIHQLHQKQNKILKAVSQESSRANVVDAKSYSGTDIDYLLGPYVKAIDEVLHKKKEISDEN